ncbi:hypothetical protein [Candidatus Phytoplasma sacchari]|uniref:Uncharacterized protein n=1 Tax=Candidatus Phytoplasma sacchari TaxID=2609813 RepID=A0ABY7M1R4_9MOLU|nr:hypothetical protein O7R10_01260 [Candidatus Phytoplasma sacchari]
MNIKNNKNVNKSSSLKKIKIWTFLLTCVWYVICIVMAINIKFGNSRYNVLINRLFLSFLLFFLILILEKILNRLNLISKEKMKIIKSIYFKTIVCLIILSILFVITGLQKGFLNK